MLPPGPKYKNHYYYLSPKETMNHTEANTRCRQEHGGYLAEINDEAELDFISNEVLNSLGDDDPDGIRIGAKWSGPPVRDDPYATTEFPGQWVFMTSGDDVTYIYTKPSIFSIWSYQLDMCLYLYRGDNSGSGRNDSLWYMDSWFCSTNRYNRRNLCEIPAAAGCDR